MLFSRVLALAGLSIVSVDATATVALEQLREPPRRWAYHHDAEPSDKIRITIALKETGLDQLKARLAHTSDPSHPEYGHHLTQEQVRGFRSPDRSRVSEIYAWLLANGVHGPRVHDSWISFVANATTAKTLFEADLAYYSYDETAVRLRALSYTVPERFQNDIKFVHPLSHFVPPQQRSRHPEVSASKTTVSPPHDHVQPAASSPIVDMPCFTGTYPECIKKLYNITYNQTQPSPVRFGIGGFLEQYVNYNDVKAFMTSYAPELTNLTPPYYFNVEGINNGSDPNPQEPVWISGIEASLDVEYSMAMAYPASITYYSTGGRGEKLNSTGGQLSAEDSDNEPYFDLLQALLAKPDATLPHVLSISYADDEQSVPAPYAQTVCDMFASLAARGVSIFVATGDGGAVGTGQTQCVSNDGDERKSFISTFPATCPYVTSIGAVDNVGPPLTGAQFSAGGFSNLFWRPDWQDAAVGDYVKKLSKEENPRMGLFNAGGRAVPDISAVGGGFQIQLAGSVTEVLGTSASTPVVAAMVALVNDARLRAGKNSTGWLNPTLYSDKVRGSLTDVVKGTSAGCTFPDNTYVEGWEAGPGYDCVTGLGVVGDFNSFLAALM